jgi:fructuronate reductase
LSALPPAEMQRLSPERLGAVRPGVAVPDYDRGAARVGVVHFGPGAFHRAHQAYYFDRLLARDPRWAICAVSPNSAGVCDALTPQGGLYTLAELDARTTFRVIGSLKEVLVAPGSPDAVFARLTSPDVQLVTLTVTEKGYCLDAGGALDLTHVDIRHDLASPHAPVSVIGWIAEGLARRRAAGLAPFVSVSCDNLADNGLRLGRAVAAFARARGDAGLAAWIEGEARFPRTMVDSITPATDDALRTRVAAELGLFDAWPVQREAFVQWVIENDLGPDAPDLASVGVTLTADVAGFERAKLRLLNGAHSSLAYLGLLAGRETVGEAMNDPALAGFVRRLMIDDIAPSLTPPPGLVISDYVEAILARFRNPAIRHSLAQIAGDGSQKLPIRLMGAIADALAAGRPVERLAAPVAAWMRFVAEAGKRGETVVDPLADQLMAIGARCEGRADRDVPAFLALGDVFAPDIVRAPRFRQAVEAAYDDLLVGGPARLLARLTPAR